jgi:hypothetical protein
VVDLGAGLVGLQPDRLGDGEAAAGRGGRHRRRGGVGHRLGGHRREGLADAGDRDHLDVVALDVGQAGDGGAPGRLPGDAPADLDLLAAGGGLGHGVGPVAGDGRGAGDGLGRGPGQPDAAGDLGRDQVGRPWRAGLERAVGAAAHAGAAELAELGDGEALPVAVDVGLLPGQQPLAQPGVGRDPGHVGVVEHVGGGEGVARELQARGVAAPGGRGERPGKRAHVAPPDGGVGQGRLDDPLLGVVTVDAGADVAGDGHRGAALDRVGVHEGVPDRGVAGRRVAEPDGHDVTGQDVRGDLQVGAGPPAVAAGVVDLEGDVALGDDRLGRPDDPDPWPGDLDGRGLPDVVPAVRSRQGRTRRPPANGVGCTIPPQCDGTSWQPRTATFEKALARRGVAPGQPLVWTRLPSPRTTHQTPLRPWPLVSPGALSPAK